MHRGCATAAFSPAWGRDVTVAASLVNLSLPQPLRRGVVLQVGVDEKREVGASGSSAEKT